MLSVIFTSCQVGSIPKFPLPTADGEERVELLAESLVFDPGDCGFAATHESDHHQTHGTGVSPGHEERRTEGEQLRGGAEPGIFLVFSIPPDLDAVALRSSAVRLWRNSLSRIGCGSARRE